MAELADFIAASPVVAHNAGFDRKFLEHEAQEFLGVRKVRMLCTLLLARRVFPGRPSYKLGNIVREVGIDVPGQLHRASADTWVTTHLFARLCAEARSRCQAFDDEVLHKLQRIRVAAAHEWLAGLGGSRAVIDLN